MVKASPGTLLQSICADCAKEFFVHLSKFVSALFLPIVIWELLYWTKKKMKEKQIQRTQTGFVLSVSEHTEMWFLRATLYSPRCSFTHF